MARPQKALTTTKGRRYFYPLPVSTEEEERKPKLTSVTTILNFQSKPNLYDWYAKMAATEAVKTREEWTKRIHTRAAEILNEEDDITTEEAVLKAEEGVINQIKGAANRAKNRAGRVGTAIHLYVQRIYGDGWTAKQAIEEVRGGRDFNDVTSAQLDPWLKPIHTFMDKYVKKVIYAERTMYNPKLNYAGTPDLIFQSQTDQTVVADWKTGKYIGQQVGLQLYAYASSPYTEPDASHYADNGDPIYWDNQPEGEPTPKIDYGLVLHLNGNFGINLKKVKFTRDIKDQWTAMAKSYHRALKLDRKATKWIAEEHLLQLEVKA